MSAATSTAPTTSAPLARPAGRVSGGAIGAAVGTLPPEYDPDAVAKAGTHLRGRIFGVGLSIAWALVFLVLGACLFFGVEVLTAVWITIVSFATVVTLSFFAELIVEPSLEKVAQEREEARIEREREETPRAGGVMTSRLALTGGAEDAQLNAALARPGVGGAAPAGRRLDVTLPEEQAGPPRAASGAVGGPGARAASSAAPAQAAPPASAAQPEGFQDLASLLKEAAQPSPVPIRQRH